MEGNECELCENDQEYCEHRERCTEFWGYDAEGNEVELNKLVSEGGSVVVVVEVVFVYPGVGQLMVDSVIKRDIPVVQGCALVFALTYIFLNLIADVISIITNPRLLYPK